MVVVRWLLAWCEERENLKGGGVVCRLDAGVVLVVRDGGGGGELVGRR